MAWSVTVDDDVTTDSFLSVATGGTAIIPATSYPTKVLSAWVVNKHASDSSTLTLTRTQTSTGVTSTVAKGTYGTDTQGNILEGALIELERGDALTATAGTAAVLDVHVSYHRNIPKPTAQPTLSAAPAPAPAASSAKPAVWG
jgi:hypothetical protein